jgi:hypothetical protein
LDRSSVGHGRPARTDPTLYQWDRLSPEQQQAVLATISAAGPRARPMNTVLLIILTAFLIIVLIGTVFLFLGR